MAFELAAIVGCQIDRAGDAIAAQMLLDAAANTALAEALHLNVPADKQGLFGYGDVWTWVAMCPDTKLVASWMLGTRGAQTAYVFMQDFVSRLDNRIQLTTAIAFILTRSNPRLGATWIPHSS